jgi:putative membrane protein
MVMVAFRGRKDRRKDRPPLHEVGEHPDYRFSLANERTFLAWIRTSLALLAAGIAVVQLIPNFSVPGGRHVLGVVLVLLATVIAATSYRRWERSERALRLNEPLPASALPRLIGVGLTLVTILALVFLVLSKGGK